MDTSYSWLFISPLSELFICWLDLGVCVRLEHWIIFSLCQLVQIYKKAGKKFIIFSLSLIFRDFEKKMQHIHLEKCQSS